MFICNSPGWPCFQISAGFCTSPQDTFLAVTTCLYVALRAWTDVNTVEYILSRAVPGCPDDYAPPKGILVSPLRVWRSCRGIPRHASPRQIWAVSLMHHEAISSPRARINRRGSGASSDEHDFAPPQSTQPHEPISELG